MTPIASAQQYSPHLAYLLPAGGQQGTTFQVTAGGQFLDSAAKAWVSGRGVQTKVIEVHKPITPKQNQDLKAKLEELRDKPKTDAVLKEIAEIRKKLATFIRRPNPALAETVTLEVTLAADAEPGPRELRIQGAAGLSNPLAFHVGQLPEFLEKQPAAVRTANAKGKKKGSQSLKPAAAKSETPITLPAVVNGRIMPGESDRYRFEARKGQNLIVAARARSLIPYLADAVPGWFQAAVALHDAKGNELAYDDHYRFEPDPVLHFRIPKDGQYVLEIHDSIYRGREDFIYRVALGELPYITSIFPLGGRCGEETAVELRGWNLPTNQVTVAGGEKTPGIRPVSARKEKLISNTMPFSSGTLPECLEQEPNNDPAHAQPIKLPMVINGRIDQSGDWDVFCVEGRAGQRIVAEVTARRLNSPLDSVLRLTDAAGRELAVNDDYLDKGSGLSTHHADSYLMATLPTDGRFFLWLGDMQRQGGAAYAYRLRLSAPMPDFELRVVPSSINARTGMTVPITVYALRRDGFSDEIALALKDAPRGFVLSGGRIPSGQDQVRLTLTAPSTALEEPARLGLEGRATIEGRPVARLAVPADDMMQAFAYHHLVVANDPFAAVDGPPRPATAIRMLSRQPVKLAAGTTVPCAALLAAQGDDRSDPFGPERTAGRNLDSKNDERGKRLDDFPASRRQGETRLEGKPDRRHLHRARHRRRRREESCPQTAVQARHAAGHFLRDRRRRPIAEIVRRMRTRCGAMPTPIVGMRSGKDSRLKRPGSSPLDCAT